jgi:NADPH-dependent glutamate synthase beta subunit-like oxidoreductase/NAD-dependent dihydropyrimidine dehydrogenase PreA subunit
MSIRVSRNDFVVPRCTAACPAGVDVPRYIRAVRDGRYDEAVAVLREKLPLPTVCADACFAPCEDVCAYKQFGDSIAIRALKRAAVDKGADSWTKNKRVTSPTGKKVAIVGAGPAGLTAAYYLASLGHQVTVIDGFPEPGGMMRYGIPKYRLPAERLDKDVKVILDLGVIFKGNTFVGRDTTIDQVKNEHDAIFIATGAAASTRIPLEGREKEGVLWGWEFLRDVALEKDLKIGSNVAVVGGGNVAIDVALTARRLGAKRIDIFCLESREEMPAHPWEIALAEEEGVFINNQWAPKKVLGEQKAVGLGLKRCSSVFDGACNFNPVYEEEITHKVEVETIILAIGQSPVFDFLNEDSRVKVKGNRIVTDEDNLATDEPGVFAGGDIATGPASIIRGIAQGRRAAESIDRFLGGSGDISETLAPSEDYVALPDFSITIKPRTDLPHLKIWERALGFDQVEKPMTEEQVREEASRCLSCDARKFDVVLYGERCKECGYCTEVCGVGTFAPAAEFNAKGYRPMQVESSEHCVGCFKCFFSCPDFAIDIKERAS